MFGFDWDESKKERWVSCMKNKLFYRKLLITYIVFIFIYTSFMMIMFFYGVKPYNTKQIQQKHRTYLDQYGHLVDESYHIVNGIVQQLVNHNEIRSFVLNKEIDYYNLIELYHLIHNNVTPFNHLGIFLTVGTSESDKLINDIGSLSETSFYHKMNFDIADKADLYRRLAENGQRFLVQASRSSYYTRTEIDYLTFMMQQKLTKKRDLLAYVSIPQDKILPQLVQEDDSFLLFVKEQKILVRRSYQLSDQDHYFNQIEARLAANQDIQLKDFFIYSYVTDIDGVSLYYGVRKPNMRIWIFDMAGRYWFVYCLIILLGGVASYFITRRLYGPISNLVELFRTKYGEQVLADEFEMIFHGTDKMFIKNQELKTIIENNQNPLKIKFLRELLYGLPDPEMIESAKERYDLAITEEIGLVLIEFINYLSVIDRLSESGWLETRKNIEEQIKEQLTDFDCLEMIDMDVKRIALLMPYQRIQPVLQELVGLVTNIEAEFEIELILIAAEKAACLTDLKTSYGFVVRQLEHKGFLPKDKILYSSDFTHIQRPRAYYYPFDVERNLMHYVEQNKREEVHLLLDHILDQNFSKEDHSGQANSYLVFAITATIHRILNQQYKTLEAVFGNDTILYLELKGLKKASDFRAKTHQLFDTLLDKMEGNEAVDEGIGKRLLAYFRDNYQEDISLNDLADKFHITPTYVSILFKKEQGKNFKDYINGYKIEQAKKIIEQNYNIKNRELAEAVGFNNVNTFLRLFKKYTGTTPGKYIETHSK